MPPSIPPAPALERVSATRVRLGGREYVAFAGCDYLGLAHHGDVVSALTNEAARSGVSAGASPSTTGRAPAHEELEHVLARFLGVEAVLLTADGYLSNLVAAQAVAAHARRAFLDRDSHVSARDAVRAAGFEVREYANVDELREPDTPCVVFTDGVFPSQRRLADVGALAQLLGNGVRALVVDESHGLGVHGRGGRGVCAEHVHADVIVAGTLSKALGSFGGFVAGSRTWIDAARCTSHAYAGATPIPPALARAAIAAVHVLAREPDRVDRLRTRARRLRERLAKLGFPVSDFDNPVFALACAPARMPRLHDALLARGLLVPRVHYPDGLGEYLRVAVCSEHTEAELDELADVIERELR